MQMLMLLSLLLGIAGAVLSSVAFFLDDHLVGVGLANELVAANVEFERLTIGDTETCVTLRRFSSTLGRWRSRETCYKMFPDKKDPGTTIRDLETGVELVLKSVCEEDEEWVSTKLGIPGRLRVEEIWQKQCRGWRSASQIVQFFTVIGSIVLVMALEAEMNDAGTRNGRGEKPVVLWIHWIHALPSVLGCVSLLIWQYVLRDPSLQTGWAFCCMTWAVVVLFAAFVVRLLFSVINFFIDSSSAEPAEPSATVTSPASTVASDDDKNEEQTQEELADADQPQNIEKPRRAATTPKKKISCACHWHCCHCGMALSTSQMKHLLRRRVSRRVRVLVRKREDGVTASAADVQDVGGEQDSSDDWDQVDATGLRQRCRPQEPPTPPSS